MDSKTTHITPANGNMFLGLGFSPDEAAHLKAHSEALIAAKYKTADVISQWIRENGLKQEDAAKILGVSRPRVSDAMNGKMEKFTLDALFAMIVRIGKTPEIIIR